mgnify:CR=1 FL=1
MKPDVQRLLELQKLLLAFSNVDRSIHRQHFKDLRLENDTEHSYNLAMTGWYLCNWFPELNCDLVIRYAMVHDLVEIYAGDTFIYASPEKLATKKQREAKALKQLAKEWPDFPEMTTLIHEYEKRKSNEAKFIYALDKIMPIMIVYLHDGYNWKQDDISAKMLHDTKVSQVALSPEIKPYFEQLHELLLSHPEIIQRG